jgi:hypothetical protein
MVGKNAAEGSVRRRALLAFAGLAVLLGLGEFLLADHPSGVDAVPGFYPVFGFLAAGLAILLAAGWGRALRRAEPRRDE